MRVACFILQCTVWCAFPVPCPRGTRKHNAQMGRRGEVEVTGGGKHRGGRRGEVEVQGGGKQRSVQGWELHVSCCSARYGVPSLYLVLGEHLPLLFVNPLVQVPSITVVHHNEQVTSFYTEQTRVTRTKQLQSFVLCSTYIRT